MEEETVSDVSWVKMGLDVVKARLKGLTKSLVPAAMALALALQVVSPTNASAGFVPAANVAANAAVTASVSANLKKKKEIFKDLVWEVNSKGLESAPQILDQRLREIRSDVLVGRSPQIQWGVVSLNRDPETKLVQASFDVSNLSQDNIPILSFSMTDASYGGCTLEPKDSPPELLAQGRTPSYIPAGGKVTYSVTISKTQSPEIMFRTGNGEFHHMKLDMRGFDEFSLPFEPKGVASYTLSNQNDSSFEIKVDLPPETQPRKIILESKDKSLRIDDINRGVVIKPDQVLKLELVSSGNDLPEASIVAKRDGVEKVFYLTPEGEVGFFEYFQKAFDRLLSSINSTNDVAINANQKLVTHKVPKDQPEIN
jgi:hypothetical protein